MSIAEPSTGKHVLEAGTTGKDMQLEKTARVDASAPGSVITTNFGVKISDDDHSLKVGERGPVLLEVCDVITELFSET